MYDPDGITRFTHDPILLGLYKKHPPAVVIFSYSEGSVRSAYVPVLSELQIKAEIAAAIYNPKPRIKTKASFVFSSL
jgi:hypothetical protein